MTNVEVSYDKQEFNSDEHSGNIVLDSEIQKKDMSLSIVYIALYDFDNRLTQLECVANFAWKDFRPTTRKTDSLAANWDSSLFTYKSGSFSARDTYWFLGEDKVYQSHSNPAILNQGGLGWYANLVSNSSGYGPTTPYGVADWKLIPAHSNNMHKGSSNAASVNLQYIHNYNIFLASSSFSKNGVGVNINSAPMCDEVATCFNFYYDT